MVLYILFETASGFALFNLLEAEAISDEAPQVQKSITDFSSFSSMLKLESFMPFTSAESALECINAVSEGLLPEALQNFLEMNFPKKKKSFKLGVAEEKLGGAISEALGVSCVKNKNINELLRGLRLHFAKFLKGVKKGDVEKAQLGLGHSYSRCKVKFNANRSDNMIIQAIALLDTMDKDFNTFSMRCKEMYSLHFPEMGNIVTDNMMFARCVLVMKNKSELSDEKFAELEKVVMDTEIAKAVIDAANSSMGADLSELDMLNIVMFAKRVVDLGEYKASLQVYLRSKMSVVAPNLSALIGEHVGARLISHAGSLTNLAKCPASTVQILGAEKALFRALKTRGNTPKYGLLFHSSYIGRASTKNKGRISRYLANKCSIASRIDAFSDVPTDLFGKKLADQVEERLQFYDSGDAPRKNVDVMKEACEEFKQECKQDGMEIEDEDPVPKKRKRKSSSGGKPKTPKKKTKKKGSKTPKKKKGSKTPKKKRRKSSS